MMRLPELEQLDPTSEADQLTAWKLLTEANPQAGDALRSAVQSHGIEGTLQSWLAVSQVAKLGRGSWGMLRLVHCVTKHAARLNDSGAMAPTDDQDGLYILRRHFATMPTPGG